MKKQIALILAVLTLASMTTAFAVPDVMTTYQLQTIDNPGEAFTIAPEDDSALDDRMRLSIFTDVDEEVIAAPIQWWEDDWFGDPVHDKAQALTSADVDSMVLTEIVSLRAENYTGGEDTLVPVGFHFTDEYPEDFEFVAVVGSESENAETEENVKKLQDWQALKAEPVDGDVIVYFTHDALRMIDGKDSVLTLLCVTGNGAARKAKHPVVESTPSKTVTDMIKVEIQQKAGDPRDFILEIKPLNKRGREVYAEAIEHFTLQGDVISFFNETVREAVSGLLPDVDLEKLEIWEADDWITYGYDYRHGEVLARVSFPANFREGQKIVVIVGAYNDDSQPVWTAQEAEISGGGALIHFSENAVTRAELKTNILFVLAEPVD